MCSSGVTDAWCDAAWQARTLVHSGQHRVGAGRASPWRRGCRLRRSGIPPRSRAGMASRKSCRCAALWRRAERQARPAPGALLSKVRSRSRPVHLSLARSRTGATLAKGQARGGGVRQDIAADRLLGIGYKGHAAGRVRCHPGARRRAAHVRVAASFMSWPWADPFRAPGQQRTGS